MGNHDGKPILDNDDNCWMKKQYQIAGIFKMQHMDLQRFPCDLQKISIIIKAESFRNHPKFKVPPNLKRMSHWQEDDALCLYCDECSLLQYRIVKKNTYARDRASTGESHTDLNKSKRTDHYIVEIEVERLKQTHHWYELMIVMGLPLLCMSGLWDIASPSISSRLSICLLIILALAEYTSHRPAPIEKSARMTFWDWVLFVMFAFLALLVFTNTVSV